MSARIKFVLIFLIFSTPFVGSTMVYVFWKPSASGNYGKLLAPVIALPEVALAAIDPGAASKIELEKSLRGKWLMLTRASGACPTACQKRLYAMRQARLILGREQDRVLRVVLLDDEALPAEPLRQQYVGTVWLSSKTQPWLKAVPATNDDANANKAAIYGVDPLGNLFIQYGDDPDIKRMTQDFQRVLKASQIG